MAHESGKPDLDRRRLMKYIGAGSAVGLAGCSDGGDGGDGEDGGDGTGTQGGDGTVGDPDATFNPEGSDVPNRVVGGEYVDATTSDAEAGMNVLRVNDTTSSTRLAKLYDLGGFAIGPETFAGRWFESWELSSDYKTITYTLRDGLEWGGDYGQLVADDYLYNINEIIRSDWFASRARGFYQLGPDNEPITFEKEDKLTFTAELPVAKPQYLHEDSLIFQHIVPQGLAEPYVQEQDAEGLDRDEDMLDGTLTEGNLGPYTFVSGGPQANWEYERNEDYYLKDADDSVYDGYNQYYDYSDSPYFENYRTQNFKDSSAALSALQSGEINSAGITQRKVSNFRGAEDINLWENPFGNGTFWLNLNHRINGWAPIRESREVRQAMGNLYDRQTVVQEVYDGNAVPMGTYHPSWGPFYPPEDQLFTPEGTVERARELLESGTSSDYGYDSNGNFTGPEGSQVTLKGVRPTGNPAVELGMEYMDNRLGEAGIEMETEATDFRRVISQYLANSPENVDGVDEPDWSASGFNAGPWDQSASANDWSILFGVGFSTSPYAPWSVIDATMPERANSNIWGYHQDEFDISQTITDASTASDPEVTQEKMTELFSFLSEDMPLVWTNSDIVFQGFTDDVAGFPGDPKDWGFKSTSYFESLDSSRLLSFKQQ